MKDANYPKWLTIACSTASQAGENEVPPTLAVKQYLVNGIKDVYTTRLERKKKVINSQI